MGLLKKIFKKKKDKAETGAAPSSAKAAPGKSHSLLGFAISLLLSIGKGGLCGVNRLQYLLLVLIESRTALSTHTQRFKPRNKIATHSLALFTIEPRTAAAAAAARKKEATTATPEPPSPSPAPINYAEHVLQNNNNEKKQTIMGNYPPPKMPSTSATTSAAGGDNHSTDDSTTGSGGHHRFASYASGASTPDWHSDDGSDGAGSHHSTASAPNNRRASSNPKMLTHSTSAIGLDEMIEDRRCDGDLRQNVVHIEVPFGKPIEEVYEGVHTGPVLGSGISGLVRLVTHKATGLKYAVKVLDLGLVDTSEGLRQLREEIFIMCQLDHPNIVRLEEVYESQSEIYLVQELCLGGELFDRLDEQPDYHYTEAECARLVKQMLSAVRYLHSRGIIHRDLKLEVCEILIIALLLS